MTTQLHTVTLEGNALAQAQRLTARFDEVTQSLDRLGRSVGDAARQIAVQTVRMTDSFHELGAAIGGIRLDSLTAAVERVRTAIAGLAGPSEAFRQTLVSLWSAAGVAGREAEQAFAAVGRATDAAGLPLAETAAAIGVLAQNNLRGAEAGEALRGILEGMQTVLGADLGGSGLPAALEALRPLLADGALLAELFGAQQAEAARHLVEHAAAVGQMSAGIAASNAAQAQAAVRSDGVQQMLARCRSRVEELKTGFFELTGTAGGYATVLMEQALAVADLWPKLELLGKGIRFLTGASKLQALWTGAVSTATAIWSGIQWVLNASLWACPLTWIVAAVLALIGAVVLCATKVEGWGRQWDSIVKFMKLTGKLFVETIKWDFNTMVNAIMIGLDYIKIGWYKFKEAVGLGDSTENQQMIAQLSGDIESRKQTIAEGAQKLRDMAREAGSALTWELSWKEKKQEAPEPDAPEGLRQPKAAPAPSLPAGIPGGLPSGMPSGAGQPSGQNNPVPDRKGSATYTAIASRLSSVRIPSLATAAASLAMPATVAATTLPAAGPALSDPARSTYADSRGGVTMSKFCDRVEIHIASADGKGYEQIEQEVTSLLRKVMDEYEA